ISGYAGSVSELPPSITCHSMSPILSTSMPRNQFFPCQPGRYAGLRAGLLLASLLTFKHDLNLRETPLNCNLLGNKKDVPSPATDFVLFSMLSVVAQIPSFARVDLRPVSELVAKFIGAGRLSIVQRQGVDSQFGQTVEFFR